MGGIDGNRRQANTDHSQQPQENPFAYLYRTHSWITTTSRKPYRLSVQGKQQDPVIDMALCYVKVTPITKTDAVL